MHSFEALKTPRPWSQPTTKQWRASPGTGSPVRYTAATGAPLGAAAAPCECREGPDVGRPISLRSRWAREPEDEDEDEDEDEEHSGHNHVSSLGTASRGGERQPMWNSPGHPSHSSTRCSFSELPQTQQAESAFSPSEKGGDEEGGGEEEDGDGEREGARSHPMLRVWGRWTFGSRHASHVISATLDTCGPAWPWTFSEPGAQTRQGGR